MSKGKDDRRHHEALEDGFLASDPPASSGIVGPGAQSPPRAPHERDDESRPKGPTHERHATETAYHWEYEDRSLPD
jgi:hypothetical protein